MIYQISNCGSQKQTLFIWRFPQPNLLELAKWDNTRSSEVLTSCVSFAAGQLEGLFWARRRRRRTAAAASGGREKSQRVHQRSRRWCSGGANLRTAPQLGCASATRRPPPKRTTTTHDPFRTSLPPHPLTEAEYSKVSLLYVAHRNVFEWALLAVRDASPF